MTQRTLLRLGARIADAQRPFSSISRVAYQTNHVLASTATRSSQACIAKSTQNAGHRLRQMSTSSMAIVSDPMGLGNLIPAQRTKPRKRLGRGQGSGRGGTSTRGHNGQRSRAGNGKPKAGFEGGQTPITRRYPKRGFTNVFSKEYVGVNMDRIQTWINDGRLDPSKPITARELYESACVHSYGDGIKVMGRGSATLRQPVHLVVSRATPAAIAAVEQAGGSIVCKYYSKTSLRVLVKPEKYIDTIPIRQPDPTHKRELIYYASSARRGYLASQHAPITEQVASPKDA